jgi:hypothetical protein
VLGGGPVVEVQLGVVKRLADVLGEVVGAGAVGRLVDAVVAGVRTVRERDDADDLAVVGDRARLADDLVLRVAVVETFTDARSSTVVETR